MNDFINWGKNSTGQIIAIDRFFSTVGPFKPEQYPVFVASPICANFRPHFDREPDLCENTVPGVAIDCRFCLLSLTITDKMSYGL